MYLSFHRYNDVPVDDVSYDYEDFFKTLSMAHLIKSQPEWISSVENQSVLLLQNVSKEEKKADDLKQEMNNVARIFGVCVMFSTSVFLCSDFSLFLYTYHFYKFPCGNL